MEAKEEWEMMKQVFASITTEIGILEYQKQGRLAELTSLDKKMKEFWEKNKEALTIGESQKSDQSNP